MLKKSLFVLAFSSIASFSFGTFVPYMTVEEFLPSPITTSGTNFLKFKIKTCASNPTAPFNIVINIAENFASSRTNAYIESAAMIRFFNEPNASTGAQPNPNSLIDLRNGTAYVFNTDGLKMLLEKNYYLFVEHNLTASPKTYTVYGRTEDMTEMYTLGIGLQYRKVPVSKLAIYSVIYKDDPETILPTHLLQLEKIADTNPLTFATSIDIATSTFVPNTKTALAATTVPQNANAGIVWKVKSGAATIINDSITVTDNNPVVLEAYAVTPKGASAIVTTKTLVAATGIKGVKNDLGIKLNQSVSKTGVFNVSIPESSDVISYNVVDICGRKIYSGDVENDKLDIGTTTQGVYFVNFIGLGGRQTCRVIVK